jgi:hypothetical protein
MAFNWAYGRKQYYMKEGWKHYQVRGRPDGFRLKGMA